MYARKSLNQFDVNKSVFNHKNLEHKLHVSFQQYTIDYRVSFSRAPQVIMIFY